VKEGNGEARSLKEVSEFKESPDSFDGLGSMTKNKFARDHSLMELYRAGGLTVILSDLRRGFGLLDPWHAGVIGTEK
jgi:hypothetical protein